MTTITLKIGKRDMEFTAHGHCGASENGVDLVCAAVSMLSCTLINRLEKLSALLSEKHISYDTGCVEIYASWKKECEETVKNSVDTLLCGYRLLANAFPYNVRLNITENDGEDFCVKKKRS